MSIFGGGVDEGDLESASVRNLVKSLLMGDISFFITSNFA